MSYLNTDDPFERLEQFLEGDLTPEEERHTLHMIADDGEMRDLLRLEYRLTHSVRNSRDTNSFSVPGDFTDEVMTCIERLEDHSAQESSWFDLLSCKIKSLFTPREFTFRPAMIMAVPAVVVILFATLFQVMPDPFNTTAGVAEAEYVADEEPEKVWMRFVYIDSEASQMAVAGNFSNWEPVQMDSRQMGGQTVWTGLIPVERGEHRYMFVRDGEEWISDPLAEIQRDDGFGNKNAVIYL